jgi:polyphosphate glucokinase
MKAGRPAAKATKRKGLPRTLAVDIGGTGIKAITLDDRGKALTNRSKIPTPKPATPAAVMAAIRKLAGTQGRFDRVSVGFPGVVKQGVVYTAPNLARGWAGCELEKTLERKLGCPVRLANDADVQGLGCIRGQGVEIVITLGTGFGSVLFVDGHRIHMELGHHPFRKGRTYEEELGNLALDKKGKKKWNKRLQEAIEDLRNTFNFDRLYIGGGNAKYITGAVQSDVSIISNLQGLLGGIALWRPRKKTSARLGIVKPATNKRSAAANGAAPGA